MPAGRRALRNVALGYLATRGRPEDIARAATHFAQSRNLTDETSALSILSQINAPEREAAFTRFYERWKDDHLVIDHWFAYQAIAPQPSTLASVKKLTRHPLFSMQNPNKVRAVLGAFARENLSGFHRADGAGYEFFMDEVLKIDAENPQLAARLVTAVDNWGALEPARRERLKAALARIPAARGVSTNLYEIATRLLGG